MEPRRDFPSRSEYLSYSDDECYLSTSDSSEVEEEIEPYDDDDDVF